MGSDIASVLAIGGPSSVVTAVLVILIKAYLDARKDKREDRAAKVQNESGVVDNAKKVMELVQGETDRMEVRIVGLGRRAEQAEERSRELEAKINDQEDKIARLERQNEFLREDLAKAHKEIQELRDSR
jgi:chromosome segregation ATPase